MLDMLHTYIHTSMSVSSTCMSDCLSIFPLPAFINFVSLTWCFTSWNQTFNYKFVIPLKGGGFFFSVFFSWNRNGNSKPSIFLQIIVTFRLKCQTICTNLYDKRVCKWWVFECGTFFLFGAVESRSLGSFVCATKQKCDL